MADDHDDRARHQHRGALALVVQEDAQHRGEAHGQDGEDAEQAGGRGGVDLQGLLEEVRRIALEREDGAVVQHAQQGHNPEHLALEDGAEVAHVEFVLRGLLVRGEAGGDQLLVELRVHEGEDDEVQQADAEQRAAESHRGHDGAAELGADQRGDPHDAEHTQAGDGHLKAHGEGHFLALEPLGEDLGDVGPLHLAAAAKDHETERGHLGAGGHLDPPGAEPLGEARGLEPVAHADELDRGAEDHQAGGQDAGEAHPELVEDDAGEDQEAADVEDVLGGGVFAEHGAAPAEVGLHEGFERGHDVHEHVGEEHHQGDQGQHGPTRHRIVVHQFLNLFSHGGKY